MRILFLTDNFFPEVNAPANRTYEHCKEWVQHGVEVTVLTCVPNFPRGKIFNGYKNKIYQEEEIDGIKVIRVWSYIAANEGFTRRILDYLSYAIMAFWVGLFVRTDLIIATSPQFFTAIAGFFLSIVKRKKWVFEVRDLWPESVIAVNAMRRNIFIHFFEWVEKRLYRSADSIVVVTDTFKKKIIERDIDPQKISVYKNGVNLDFFSPSEKDNKLLKEIGVSGKFIIGYIGTHGMAHGLNFILNSVKKIQNDYEEIVFLFIGDGAEKRNLLSLAEELSLKNSIFLDSVPKNEVVQYLNLLDVALVNLRQNSTFQAVIPSKIFEAAAMQKPILLGLEGETKDIIEKYNAGICFHPEDERSFIDSVIEMSSDKEKFKDFRIGCKKLANDFSRKEIALKYLQDLKCIYHEN